MHPPPSTPQDHQVFWAKLPREVPPPRPYHPVICHLIDVASVTEALWEAVLTSSARARIAGRLDISEEAARRWVAFLAGLHDIGKVSPAFQLQVDDPEVRLRLLQAGFQERQLGRPEANTPHGITSAIALRDEILGAPPYGVAAPVIREIATLVGGHHGLFPTARALQDAPLPSTGEGRWRRARQAMAGALAALLEVPTAERPERLDHAGAIVLAGLISVADWIGSDTRFFHYAAPAGVSQFALDIGKYRRMARQRAFAALEQLGWTGWTPAATALGFSDLFGGKQPRGAQQEAIALAETIGHPAMAIVEAPMGEGKTEAAMYLADRSFVRYGAAGCYFALPTQATSNQMFGRVREFLLGRYPHDVVNMQLLHGHAALSAEFQELRQRHELLLAPREIWDLEGAGPARGDVVAAEWFTHRKRGLLAPFGVGTVDQALLSVLQTKHVFVRLFALANKTVIIDEVHAYDTYMTTLIERLLEWLAALGTTVVLLSATLPGDRRQALLRAYARGLGAPEPAVEAVPYPRISWASATSAGARPVTAASSHRLAVHWVDGATPDAAGAPFHLGEQLREALARGGCAAVICNTVRRAQQVYTALKPYFPGQADDGLPALDLFHARYLFKDRDRRERRALLRFGKAGGTVELEDGQEVPVRRPDRAVLVATQVIEQSLDLDFDLMATDLAPVDLVLQRSGRLWRHERGPRPAGLGELPPLWICRPRLTTEALPVHEPGFEHIYDAHVLLRSWLALKDKESMAVPEQVEDLIEAVYRRQPPDPALPAAVRQHWQDTFERYRAAQREERSQARECWLKSPSDADAELWQLTANPQEEDAPDLHTAHQALTRLSEPTVQVICLMPGEAMRLHRPQGNGGRKPPSGDRLEDLLRHAVTLGDRRAVTALLPEPPPEAWRESPLLRRYRLLLLDAAGIGRRSGLTVQVDDELGVVISG